MYLFLCMAVLFAQSCEEYDLQLFEFNHRVTHREEQIQKRADQMGKILWVAQNEMPAKQTYIQAGTLKQGVPYSSVKEVGGYVGFDVSFYTFLSATVNPRSVLYTEDLSKEPYHSTNATTYYGTVCSSTIAYALGLDLPYSTAAIPDLPYVSKLEHQCVDSLKIGDMLWRTGHVMMVYDMHYSELGTLSHISILESATGTSISSYSYWNLKKRICEENLIIFRSTKEVGEQIFKFDDVTDSRMLHYSLCPNKGDKSVYSKNAEVTINILDTSFTSLIINRNGQQKCVIPINSVDITLSDLDEGAYEAYLSKDNFISEKVSFEILNTDFSYQDLGNVWRAFFSSKQGYPEYIFYVLSNGAMQKIYELTDEDRRRGYKDIPKNPNDALSLRLVVKSDYGRAYSSFVSTESKQCE